MSPELRFPGEGSIFLPGMVRLCPLRGAHHFSAGVFAPGMVRRCPLVRASIIWIGVFLLGYPFVSPGWVVFVISEGVFLRGWAVCVPCVGVSIISEEDVSGMDRLCPLLWLGFFRQAFLLRDVVFFIPP